MDNSRLLLLRVEKTDTDYAEELIHGSTYTITVDHMDFHGITPAI